MIPCGNNTVLKWLTFSFERWNHLHWDCVYTTETETDLFEVKSYFLRLQLSQNFIFALSGLALAEFRLNSLISAKEGHSFTTEKEKPFPASTRPLVRRWPGRTCKGTPGVPPSIPVISVFGPFLAARAEIKLGKGNHLNSWPLWAGSQRGQHILLFN